VEIHILTNGVHTDLVLPFQNQYIDWSKFVSLVDTKSGNPSALNVAFGWGDKGFYLQTINLMGQVVHHYENQKGVFIQVYSDGSREKVFLN
jgi:hypothetical protein